MISVTNLRKLKVGDRVQLVTTTAAGAFNIKGLVDGSNGTIVYVTHPAAIIAGHYGYYAIHAEIKWDKIVPGHIQQEYYYLQTMLSPPTDPIKLKIDPNIVANDLYTGLFNTTNKTTLEDIINGN